MKRALLIAGGTVGGLGAVLSVTPPQLNGSSPLGGLSNIAHASSAAAVSQTTTTQPTTTPSSSPVESTPTTTTSTVEAGSTAAPVTSSATPTVKKKKKVVRKRVVAAARKKKVTSAVSTHATGTTPTATSAPTAAAASQKVSGTFTGNVVNVNYGYVQVQITVVDGRITDAQALQAPSGRSDRFTQYAIPILRQQTLAAQGYKIQGASGASYTSWGWDASLQAALAKAGM